MCKLTDENLNETTNSAFAALSKFNRTNFKCSYLPEVVATMIYTYKIPFNTFILQWIKYQEKLKERNRKILNLEENKAKTIDELFSQIPASCYFDIFKNLNPVVYQGFSEFLNAALTEEIDSIPRRSTFAAREKIYTENDQQTIQKNFYSIIKSYLVDEIKTALEPSSLQINDG